jgi:hypothetical protein
MYRMSLRRRSHRTSGFWIYDWRLACIIAKDLCFKNERSFAAAQDDRFWMCDEIRDARYVLLDA